MASKRRILITTGDPDGIGWEVTRKALSKIGPQAGVQFVFYRHTAGEKQPLRGRLDTVTVADLSEVETIPFRTGTAIEILNSKSPALWVEEAARACMKKRFQALVTAPLSKTSIIESGLKDIGHTEILARISGEKHLFMGFRGREFSVVLATGHIPLDQVSKTLTEELLMRAFEAAAGLRAILPAARRRLPLALVGLNPHAGEQGLLGCEEANLKDWIKRAGRRIGPIAGPLVPDAAFLPQNWKRYSVYVTPYHDQGLIPFKLVHGFESGVHLTLGLPFVRTSVDHGTAKEIFGEGKADAGSMHDAIMTAVRLTREGAR